MRNFVLPERLPFAPMVWVVWAIIAVMLWGAIPEAHAKPGDPSTKVVTRFIDQQGPDFEVLDEEFILLVKAVETLSRRASIPSDRMRVWDALQGLEKGDARAAADVLTEWYDSGDLNEPDSAQQMAVMVGVGNIRAAHAAFRRAMRVAPGDPSNWFLLGHALTRGGKDSLAEMAFQQVQLLSNLSDNQSYLARAAARLGAIYLGQGKRSEAEEVLSDAIRVLKQNGPEDELASALVMLGQIYGSRAEAMFNDAAAAYTRAGRTEDANQINHRAKAVSHALKGRENTPSRPRSGSALIR